MRANGANRATFLRESNFIVWKVFELSALSSHQSGRAFVAAENVYTPREGGDDRNYKNTIGHGSTIVATYAATLHKILPSPPSVPMEWCINDDLWKRKCGFLLSILPPTSDHATPSSPPCKNPLLYAVANCLELLADCEGEDRTNYLNFHVERDTVTIGNDWIVFFSFFLSFLWELYKIIVVNCVILIFWF